MEGTGEGRKLKRYLAPVDVWALSIGCIIGWGAFVMPGTTFLPVAGPLGTMIAMAFSAGIMLIIGTNYAWLMKRYPGIGGVYAYTKRSFGRDHAFLSSWFLCLAYMVLIPQNATALTLIGRALAEEKLMSGPFYRVAGYDVYLYEVGIAAAALVIVCLLAIFAKAFVQRLQTFFALVLLAGVIVIAAMASSHIRWDTLQEAFGSMASDPVQGILSIVVLAPWAFVGFEVVSLETAHFKFPVRSSRRLIVGAILIGGFIYAAMAVIAVSVVPDGYASWWAYIGDLGNAKGCAALPTFYAARELMGPAGLAVMAVTALAAVLTSLLGFYRASARILANMEEDKILTKNFSSTSFCFVFIMGIAIALSLFGRNVLAWVVDLSSLGAIIGFGYASAAAYRTASAEQVRRVRITGAAGTGISILFAIVQLLPRASLIDTMDTHSYLLLAVWCLAGFIFYWRTMNQSRLSERGGEHVTVGALFSLLFYSMLVWYVRMMMDTGGAFSARALPITITFFGMVLTGLIVMFLINDQLRKRQLELERERIRALEESRAKSRFLFNMSHDIRTPMNAILGFTHLGLDPVLTAEEKDEYLRKIDSSGEQLLGIINDVLDMSRIESGRMELDPAPMDLREVLEETRSLFADQMRTKGLQFTAEAEQLEDPWVVCDRNRISRVLLNLLSNAYKFTPEGGEVSLGIRQQGRMEERGVYEILVRDTGIGMSRDFVDSIFAPFERERSSTVSGIQGTGLGMSITKGIVDAMGGSIRVGTEQGRGTEFTIRLELETVKGPGASGEGTGEVLADVRLEGRRILLVDDNELNLEIARLILEQAGLQVDTAEDGSQAVRMVEGQAVPYDLILMDIQMPVMNGYEASAAIRALSDPVQSRTPIIALTANAFKEDEEAAEEAGMQGHIAKPLEVEKLMGTIRRVLDEADRG